MASERNTCAAVPVDETHVLIVGGRDNSDAILASTELLDLTTMLFEPGPSMQKVRGGCAATRLDFGDGQPRILVIGGADADEEQLSTTEVLFVDDRRSDRAARRRV